MEFSIKMGNLEKQKTGCLVVGVFEDQILTAMAEVIDNASQGFIKRLMSIGDMEGKVKSTLVVHSVPGVVAERVLLVGLGKVGKINEKIYRDATYAAIAVLKNTGTTDILFALVDMPVKDCGLAWRVRQTVMIAEEALYRRDQLKSKKEDEKSPKLKSLAFSIQAKSDSDIVKEAIEQGQAIALGMGLTRDLGNLPGNICTPTYLAEQAKALAKAYKLKCEVLDKADMEKLGMGSLLSVSKGSHQPPKFIVLQYAGGKAKAKPVVLVGKGVTFDTGGISLKPAAEMDEMKFDMCGAASVLGTFKALAMMELPLNVIGLIPTVENMPGGAASRPGDVVTSLSGQTIEILNTDAEGRLILCDALTYAERFKPDCVVDIATLTGACVIALGHVGSGLVANDDDLAAELLEAGQKSYDRAWQLPLWEEYQEQIDTPFADMANVGGRAAGTVTAACFLSRFTKSYPWAHLDIAGTAWKSGKEKGATARPVPLLTHFLMNRASKLKLKK